MTVDLHERLSEFSYGYGVTREVEKLLEDMGLQVTPFLPSLLDEGSKGYDVKFSKPGKPLLLQFKLGQEVRRFRRKRPTDAIPSPLNRPFWRFKIDISEAQFQLLESAQGEAEVYYVAPRFSTWSAFDEAFQQGRVIEQSLLLTPSDIRDAIQGQGNVHRIVYDTDDRYVCSDPKALPESTPSQIADRISRSIRGEKRSLSSRIDSLFLKRVEEKPPADRLQIRASEFLKKAGRSDMDVRATTLGLEAWAHGAQLLLVTDDSLDSGT
jgi:hypothetical protein